MDGMHDFTPISGVKIMHSIEKSAKNHAYRRKRCRGAAKIMHTTAFDAAYSDRQSTSHSQIQKWLKLEQRDPIYTLGSRCFTNRECAGFEFRHDSENVDFIRVLEIICIRRIDMSRHARYACFFDLRYRAWRSSS